MMGATIPCAIQIVTADERNLGYRLGVLYSMNTVGAIIGAFLTGFFLIPWVGINSSFLLMAVINVGVGLAVVLAGDSSLRQRIFYGACGVGFSVLLLVIPPVTERSLSVGVFLNPDRYSRRLYNREVFEHIWDRDRILFYRDGLASTVAVLEGPAHRYLIVNGKTDGSNEPFDMSTQTMLAYTPLMLHESPQEVLVIGLGTGVTASSVLDFPVKAVTQVEIEAAVLEAAHYFEAENRSVLKDPKLNLVIEDGRNYLLSHQKKFDVIISEPSNPWMSGVASLFSQEHFTVMRDRLDAGGIACQWLQLYSLRPEDIRMVVRTFHSVFPEVHIFQTSPGDILLLGSKDQLSIDPERIVALFDENPHMGERLQEIQLPNPLVFLEWAYRLDREGVSSFLGEGRMIHTDDRPFLELSAPRTLHESYFRGILQEFLPLMPPSLVEGYFVDPEALGRHYLDTALVSRLHKDSARESFYFKKAVVTAPEDPAVQLELAARDFGENRVDAAIRRAEAVLRAHPQHREAAFYLARLHFVQESWEKMPELLGQLLDGSDTAAVWSRLRLAESQSQPQEQLQWLENAYQIDPESLEVLFALANYYRMQGDRLLEAKYLAGLLKVEPTQYTANLRLGELALEREELQEARNQLLTAIGVQPDDPQPHVLLAQTYLALGRPEWANLEYRKSLSLR
ncbi:MAG: tetratricopeptide repeat protein [Acidobacteria bacterium]|nr:tetratricopeptide repeat protein [Acidobacteriota bacterium]